MSGPAAAAAGRPGERGFGVVEVLVAFLVLSLGLAALYRSAGLGARALAAGEAREAALGLGQSLMDRAVAGDPSLGREGTDGGGLAWRVDERPFEGRASRLVRKTLSLAEVTVAVDGRGRGAAVRLSRVVVRAPR